MSYYCDKCLKHIKKKINHSHLKSKSHKEVEKYEHIVLPLKNVDIKDVDEILYLYIKGRDKRFNHHLIKGEFNLVFINNRDCKNLIKSMIDNTTNISLSNYLRESIDSLKREGCDFNQIAEMDIITLAHKRDMTYDFYLKHNMSAFEWKVNAMINKDKNLIENFPRKWRHPINTKFDGYRNNII